ncbi:F-box protein CPR1-like [Nicotiana tomentosiformis]|uniref:F-box protein CPR1-like n=1 Tax=Nicotiana tomentosiformis TaxID=4098 RepID=UPI00388CACE0
MGYDSTSDDYKILKIDVDIDDGRKVSSEILALKNVSWRKIDRHPSDICYVLSGGNSLAFVHGAFHWLGFSQNYSMVSFSISNEVYKEIQLPEQICLGSMYNKFDVSVLEGMLCVYSTSIRKQSTFSFWLMKDYGVKESWTKLFTIRDTEIYLAIPKYRFADGEVLLRCIHAESCGPLLRTSKGPFGLWPQGDIFQDGFVFTESLISPKLLT